MPKKSKQPSSVLWTGIAIAFSCALSAGTIYAFKSGLLRPVQAGSPVPVKIVIKDEEAVPRFNALMDAANAATIKKDYPAAIVVFDQMLDLGESNDRIKAACDSQQIRSRRDGLMSRAGNVASK